VTEGYSNCEGRRICEKLEGMNNMKILVLWNVLRTTLERTGYQNAQLKSSLPANKLYCWRFWIKSCSSE
jgi:hypothetical protein